MQAIDCLDEEDGAQRGPLQVRVGKGPGRKGKNHHQGHTELAHASPLITRVPEPSMKISKGQRGNTKREERGGSNDWEKICGLCWQDEGKGEGRTAAQRRESMAREMMWRGKLFLPPRNSYGSDATDLGTAEVKGL
eukprot:2031298-Rhodomonas_salina.2